MPAGIFGSYFFLQLAGLENNIYAQVALVMLIGLLGKNAILIVEMANQYRKQGMSIFDAAVRGSVSRLRPILMTSFAFIFESWSAHLNRNKVSYDEEDEK